uniref:High-affinity choline transporter 1 n=1 Tax=Romanomermis culicivorax TaxID=13658 RepID=A0A915HT53_ROMCU
MISSCNTNVPYVAAYTDWDAIGYGYKNALENSQLILPLVLQHLTPTFVALLGLGAIAGGVMSSTDASVLSTSSMFCHNVYHAVLRPRATNKELLWVVRLGFLCAGALACFLAILDRSVYNLWVFCSDFVFVVIFPQFFLVLYCPFIEKYGYLAGTSAGFLVRIFGGEHSLGIPVVWKLPFYDFDQNRQLFPFKTFAAFSNLTVSLAVSSIITLVEKKKQKYDVTKQRNVEMRTGNWIVTSRKAGQESNPNFR